MEENSLWHTERVSAEEYDILVPDKRVFFNEPKFAELNKDRVDEVVYLVLLRENSARFGIIAGRIGDEVRIPFSAPYSYPVSIINESKQETIDAALSTFEKYCMEQGILSIHLHFPLCFMTNTF